MKKRWYWKSIIPLIIGAGICLIPVPHGLQPNAWYYFALFSAVIAALILEPIPAAAVGLVGVTVAGVLLLVTPKPADSLKWVLSGFSNGTVWLIFIAFMFAKGYEKTGLGRRLALLLVRALGKKTLGLGYAVAMADLILAPFTPSNTARSGGTIFPIIKNIPPLYDSHPGETAGKIGSYLMWTALATTCITSSMFLTALAPNLLAIELVKKTASISISWAEWATGFLPVGLILFAVTPYLIYKIYPPEVKVSNDVPAWAAEELSKLGKISSKEVIMALLAVVALMLWIFGGDWFHLDATMVALVVLSAMILTGVITWDDVISNKQAWNVLAWFATLVTLADGLKLVKFLDWFAVLTAGALGGIPVLTAMLLFVAIFFIVHYMFASITAHVAALLPVFLAAAMVVPGMPIKLLAMMFCYSLGIMGIITPFATGPSPIYYGSGYVSGKDFWRLGLIFGAIYLVVFLVIGYPYLKWITL
ncbi:MAG: DASS family sodium-coupled anion symporter [Dissulfurispiraceae bacterium]